MTGWSPRDWAKQADKRDAFDRLPWAERTRRILEALRDGRPHTAAFVCGRVAPMWDAQSRLKSLAGRGLIEWLPSPVGKRTSTPRFRITPAGRRFLQKVEWEFQVEHGMEAVTCD